MYTVELYKTDKRTNSGERHIKTVDHSTADIDAIRAVYDTNYPASKGYRYSISNTYSQVRNIMTGEFVQERYDTPYCCSVQSESFWSN